MNRFFLIIILTIFSPFSFSQVEKNTNGFYNC
ncbi:lytic transglycosylase, partial [Salmonella enterica subsp. enterica serovar Newport]|nr:lytic transglycosylase [Salmonella enterica subsp. enterica serovar Newport]